MKKHTSSKSSITLPPDELEIVNQLMKNLNAKSKVEVIRRALRLLQEATQRKQLKEQFARASLLVTQHNKEDLDELDSLSFDGLEDEN